MFRRRNNKEQEHKDVLEKEVAFWKTEMEKVVNEKNLWVEKLMKASEDNEMLRAELFFVQQDAQSTRAQLEVMRKREECRAAQSPAVGVGSSAGTPRSGLAGPAAAMGFFGPSASSANTTPVKVPTPLRSGDGGGGPFGNGSYDRGLIHQLEEQIVNLKADLVRANRQVAAAEAAAHASDMQVALVEERLVEAHREVEAARRQTEFMRTTAEAHQREADALRSEVLSQRNINDETANETTKILSELSSTQQRCAKLASELSIKEQLVGLLQLQLGDMAAAVQATSAGGALPAIDTGTVSPAWTGAIAQAAGAMHHGRSMSLASASWGFAAAHVRTTSCSGAIGSSSGGGSGGGNEPCAAAAVTGLDHRYYGQQQPQVERPAVSNGVPLGGVEWSPEAAVDDGGKDFNPSTPQSPSLGVFNGGDSGAGGDRDVVANGSSSSRGDVDGNASLNGMGEHGDAAAAAFTDGSPASAEVPEKESSEPEPSGGTVSEPAAVAAAADSPPATGAAISGPSDSSDTVRTEPKGLLIRAGSGAGAAMVEAQQLPVPKFVGAAASAAAASSATAAPSSVTAATASVEVATAAATAGPMFQEAAMQVDLNPSRQPPAVLRKSLSKGFAAATAAAGGGESVAAAAATVPSFRQHHHYQQQRPANVPQLKLGAALRGRSGGSAAAVGTVVDDSSAPATVTGKRGVTEQPRVNEVPAAKRSSVPGVAPVAPAVLSNDPVGAAVAAAAVGSDAEENFSGATAEAAVEAATIAAATTVAIAAAVETAEVAVVPLPNRKAPGVENEKAAQDDAAAAEVGAAPGTAAVAAIAPAVASGNDPSSSSSSPSEEEPQAASSASTDENSIEPKAPVARLRSNDVVSRNTSEPVAPSSGLPSVVLRISTAGPDALAADVVATIVDPSALAVERSPKAAPQTEPPASFEATVAQAAVAAGADMGSERGDPSSATAANETTEVGGATVAGEGAAAARERAAAAKEAAEMEASDNGQCKGEAREEICMFGSNPSPAPTVTEPAAANSSSGDAAAAAATSPAPAVQAPKVFRFPGARMAAAAAAVPPTATAARTGLRGQYDGAPSLGSDIPRTPNTAVHIRAKETDGNTGVSAPGASTPAAVVVAELGAPSGIPSGGGNGNGVAIPQGTSSNTFSLLKRFNSGGLGADAGRAKSPAPEAATAAAATEGVFAGSGLSSVAAAVRRISSAGTAVGGATPTAAQANGPGSSVPEPSPQPQQPTPPKRPTSSGVSTLLNKFNQVSGGGATPPPPFPGNSIGGSSGINSTVVPEYGIGGPASRVPASAKIAAMRSAYEKSKS